MKGGGGGFKAPGSRCRCPGEWGGRTEHVQDGFTSLQIDISFLTRHISGLLLESPQNPLSATTHPSLFTLPFRSSSLLLNHL